MKTSFIAAALYPEKELEESTKQLCIYAQELYISAKEPCMSDKEPYIQLKRV